MATKLDMKPAVEITHTAADEAPDTNLLQPKRRSHCWWCKRSCCAVCLTICILFVAAAARFYLTFSRGMQYMHDEEAHTAPLGGLTLNGHTLSWYKVNDVVMGGHSTSRLQAAAGGHGIIFTGNLSTVDGGFASCSTTDAALGLPAGTAAFRLSVTTDGQAYTFTAKVSESVWEPTYEMDLPPLSLEAGVRHELTLPLDAFVASRMGRAVPSAGRLDATMVRSIGLNLALVDAAGEPRGTDHFHDGPFAITLHDVSLAAAASSSPVSPVSPVPAASHVLPVVAAPLAPAVVLATFDASGSTARTWRVMNDPVMGGRSHSSYSAESGVGRFAGTCEIVPFLHAPGFCKISTARGGSYANASAFADGALHLTLRSPTPAYTGFKVAFTAQHMPDTRRGHGHHSSPSFKADFAAPPAAADGFVTVKVPFDTFSVDWSEFTGRCDTTDPHGGPTHVCCSAAHPEVCPHAHHLEQITGFSVWAEGVEGAFDVELREIAAGPA